MTFEGHFSTAVTLYEQLTRDLLAIAKLLAVNETSVKLYLFTYLCVYFSGQFLQRDAMHSTGYAVAKCLSVCHTSVIV